MSRYVFWASLLVVLASAVLWNLIDPVVQLVYDERAPQFMNELFQNRDKHDVLRYQSDAKEIVQPVLRRAALLAAFTASVVMLTDSRVRVHLVALGGHVERFGENGARSAVLFLIALLFAIVVPVGQWLWLPLAAILVFRWSRIATGEPVLASAEPRGIRPELELFVLLASAIVLRFWNLGILQPYTDEYAHMSAGLELANGEPLTYTRAGLVSRAVAVAYRLAPPVVLADFVAVGRIPGALVSAVTVIPVYLFARRFGRPAAILAGVAWALHPWATGVGRTIREYAYFSLFSTSLMLIGVALVRRAVGRPVRGLASVLLIALVSFGYALYDRASTYAAHALVGTSVVGVYWLAQTFLEGRRRVRQLLVGLALGALICAFFILPALNVPFSLDLSFNQRRFYFINLYSSGTAIVSAGNFVPIAAVMIAAAWRRSSQEQRALLLALIITFLGTLLLMSIGWDRYVRPRYGFFLLPIFLVIVAAGALALFRDLWGALSAAVEPRTHWRAQGLLVASLLALIVPWGDLVYNQRSDAHGYVRFTNEYHDRVEEVVRLLEAESKPGDALVATDIVITPLRLVGAAIVEDGYRVLGYSYTDPDRHEALRETMGRHETGFVVIDGRRARWTASLPREDFFVRTQHDAHDAIIVCVRLLDRVEGNWRWAWDHAGSCSDWVDFDAWLAENA